MSAWAITTLFVLERLGRLATITHPILRNRKRLVAEELIRPMTGQ